MTKRGEECRMLTMAGVFKPGSVLSTSSVLSGWSLGLRVALSYHFGECSCPCYEEHHAISNIGQPLTSLSTEIRDRRT